MPGKFAPLVLRVLKDAGVELTDEITAEVSDQLNEQLQLELEGQTAGEGEMIVKEQVWRDRARDLADLRKRLHAAEGRRDELQSTLDAGESDLKKQNRTLLDKLEKMEPLHNSLLESKRTEWAGIKESIPENLQDKLHWPKDENEQLSDAQILENLGNISTWKELGVPGLAGEAGEADGEDGGGPPNIPKVSPTGKSQKGSDDLEGKTATQLMEMGYEKTASK